MAINVLSLFDGISCGRIALERAGIEIENYYASEIDKYCIQVSKANYLDIIQVGDVTKLRIPKNQHIDLLIGGSPCQGFSFAGKGLNFNDPRSKLFFEFVRILKECRRYNPSILFLLENVVMKKEYQNIISQYIGVEPIMINSALVSAQNRKRLYWTNIPYIEQPKDLGILLKDILEPIVDEKYYYTDLAISYLDRNKINKRFAMYNDNNKSICLTANFQKSIPYNVFVDREKSNCIGANYGNMALINYNKSQGQIVFEAKSLTETRTEEAKLIRKENMKNGRDWSPRRGKELMERSDDKSNCLTTRLTKEHIIKIELEINKQKQYLIRKLTPIECERLQTIPDNYTSIISNTQRYKALGNGWNIDTIAHIFKNIPISNQPL